MKLSVVILAAGQGKRMHSDLPKVLQPLAGRPLLGHVENLAHAPKHRDWMPRRVESIHRALRPLAGCFFSHPRTSLRTGTSLGPVGSYMPQSV